MIPIDEKALLMLAKQHAPILRFHPSERFFPLLVESWLTTTSVGIWPEDPDRDVRLRTSPADPGRHGAAVCAADAAMSALQVLIGPPVDADRPISLSGDPADSYSMLSDLVARLGDGAFLDVGGWANGDFKEGDLAYLSSLCSELGSAINPTIPWDPPMRAKDGRPQVPWSWVPQPTNPTIYCEITWAGSYSRIAERNGRPEFPAGDRSLDQMVAFTYYLFYGARTPAAEDSAGRFSEGQWEAITMFYRAEVGRPERDEPNGHDVIGIKSGHIAEEPWAVVISQCQDRSTDSHWTAMRDFDQCEKLGHSPVIYVARGTHRNYFEPVQGQTYDPTQHGPHGPDTTTHDNEKDTWDGVDGFLAAAAVMLGIAILLVALVALVALAVVVVVAIVVAIVVLVVLAIILFIMWLVSACDESSDKDAGEEVDFGGDPDEATDGGPQAGGDGSEEAAGSGPGTGGSSTGSGTAGGGGPDANGTVGQPNTGSPTGRSTTFPDIRIVERLIVGGASERFTTFPTDQIMENPPWWGYHGRWGVRVKPAPAGGTWESGWNRIDSTERDWAYFNAERLLLVMNNGPRESN